MALNAYINDFKDGRSLKEKCFICRKDLSDNFFTLNIPEDNAHDKTRAHIKENRMCSKLCMNKITLKMNEIERECNGKTYNEYSDSNM